jgi:hypothetical protein
VVDANEVSFLMTSPWISVSAILRRLRAVDHVELQWRRPNVSVSKSSNRDQWLQQRVEWILEDLRLLWLVRRNYAASAQRDATVR